MELLGDLLPAHPSVLVLAPERVRARAHDLGATSEEFLGASWAAAASGGVAPIDLGAASYKSLGEVREHTIGRGLAWWSISPFGLDDSGAAVPGNIDTEAPDVRPVEVNPADRSCGAGSAEARPGTPRLDRGPEGFRVPA